MSPIVHPPVLQTPSTANSLVPEPPVLALKDEVGDMSLEKWTCSKLHLPSGNV